MKKCVKYIVNYCQLGSVVVCRIIDHSLIILNDDSLSVLYKDEHKIIILEFLDNLEVSHHLPFHGNKACLQSLFYYLKEIMTDTKSICDTLNLKILRILCKILYLDESSDPCKVLISIINWFKHLYEICDSSLNIIPILLSSVIIDCCSFFMFHQSINMVPIMIKYNDFIFDLVNKQLNVLQQRDNQRSSFIYFLLLLFRIMNNYRKCFPLNIYNILSNNIKQLNIILMSPDALRNSVLQANLILTISKQQSKDCFVNILNDSKTCSTFQVVMCCLYYNSKSFVPQDVTNTNYLKPDKLLNTPSDKSQLSNSNKKPRLSNEINVSDLEVEYGSNHCVNDMINKIISKVNNNLFINNIFNGLVSANIPIFESWIYILILLCREFGDGHFLIICEEKHSYCGDEHVINFNFAAKFNKLLSLSRTVIRLVIAYLSSTGNHNTQLIGAILTLSIELCRLSNKLIKEYELFIESRKKVLFCDTSFQLLFASFYDMAKIIDDIRADWTSLYISIINYLSDNKPPKVKKNSILDYLLKLVDNILRNSLVQLTNFNDNNFHWSLYTSCNIPFKDNVLLLNHFCTVMTSINEDLSSLVNKSIIESILQSSSNNDIVLFNFMTEINDFMKQDNESCQGLIYFSLFCVVGLLDRSIDNSNHTNNHIISCMGEVFASLGEYIKTTVQINFMLSVPPIQEISNINYSFINQQDSSTEYIFDRESEWFKNQDIVLFEIFMNDSSGTPQTISFDNLDLNVVKLKLHRMISIFEIVMKIILNNSLLYFDDTHNDSYFQSLVFILFILEAISIIVEITSGINQKFIKSEIMWVL